MLINFHERVPQKGKYNLYYTFGKGYVNEIRSIREHYGAVSSFSKYRSSFENTDEEQPQFYKNERNSFIIDQNKTNQMNQSYNSFKNPEEVMNKSRSFDKFLKKDSRLPTSEDEKILSNDEKIPNLKQELTLSSSLKQRSSLNKIRFGSSMRKERFENLSLNKKCDYPGEYSDMNFLVTRNGQKNEKAIDFYENNFRIKKKNFDTNKINLAQNQERLTTPLEKRLEVQDVKRNKEKYLDWKREFMNSQKKYRITKTSFRSGILNIDNPQNECTKVYQKEYEDYKRKENERTMINERHKKQMENLTKTHQDIAFFNKNIRKNPNNADSPIKISTSWTGKGRIKENFYKNYLDSHDRLFGAMPNKFSIARAENIMSCENKGKHWDIISMKVNDVQLKVDKGINGV